MFDKHFYLASGFCWHTLYSKGKVASCTCLSPCIPATSTTRFMALWETPRDTKRPWFMSINSWRKKRLSWVLRNVKMTSHSKSCSYKLIERWCSQRSSSDTIASCTRFSWINIEKSSSRTLTTSGMLLGIVEKADSCKVQNGAEGGYWKQSSFLLAWFWTKGEGRTPQIYFQIPFFCRPHFWSGVKSKIRNSIPSVPALRHRFSCFFLCR